MHEHTASEVIYERVDNKKPFVGMTNFKGNYVTKSDVKIAKNYLSEKELISLNLLVTLFLDYAELQAIDENPMTMKDWIEQLDSQIVLNKKKLLLDKGKISHEQAMKKAEEEYEIYRKREMKRFKSDYDNFKQLEEKTKTEGS